MNGRETPKGVLFDAASAGNFGLSAGASAQGGVWTAQADVPGAAAAAKMSAHERLEAAAWADRVLSSLPAAAESVLPARLASRVRASFRMPSSPWEKASASFQIGSELEAGLLSVGFVLRAARIDPAALEGRLRAAADILETLGPHPFRRLVPADHPDARIVLRAERGADPHPSEDAGSLSLGHLDDDSKAAAGDFLACAELRAVFLMGDKPGSSRIVKMARNHTEAEIAEALAKSGAAGRTP